MKKICKNCNFENDSNEKICKNCGKKLTTNARKYLLESLIMSIINYALFALVILFLNFLADHINNSLEYIIPYTMYIIMYIFIRILFFKFFKKINTEEILISNTVNIILMHTASIIIIMIFASILQNDGLAVLASVLIIASIFIPLVIGAAFLIDFIIFKILSKKS